MSDPRIPLSATVYEHLAGRIFSGDLAPRDRLPSERQLAAELGINRHAIREAVKRLQQAGLVHVSQGGATRVQSWRETGGLDLLMQLPLTPELVRDALEMRLSIGTDAARLFAERASGAAKHDVERMVAAAAGLTADAAIAVAYEELWIHIVEGSGNTAYRLALNSLVTAGSSANLRAQTLDEARDHEAQSELAAAFTAGDGAAAERIARGLLSRTLVGSDQWAS